MTTFDYSRLLGPEWAALNPVRIHFGSGCLADLPAVLPPGRILLLTSAGMTRRGDVARLRERLGPAHIVTVDDTIGSNPALDDFAMLTARHRGTWSALVALGGGSVIDTAKILSATLRLGVDFDLRRHFETGAAVPTLAPIPVCAIPTTAGTGSEVTPFATVWDTRALKKYSFAAPSLHPRWAFVDPALTSSLPRTLTVATGLDAFSQALESIWNRHATPSTLSVANKAARLAFGALQQLDPFPPPPALRAQLMEASLLAGLAISQTRTGLAHSISYPITARYGVEHGVACSFTLPAVLRFNAHADDGRLLAVSRELGFASVDRFADGIARILRQLGVPALLSGKIPHYASLEAHVSEMFTPGRSDNNLRPASHADVAEILVETERELCPNPSSFSTPFVAGGVAV